jgi:hypothetical protein
MPRTLTITTYWSAGEEGENMCNGRLTCPGVHALAERPGLLYVICASEARALDGGFFVGVVPEEIHRTGRASLARVTDRAELAAFADRMGPGEVLGTVPVENWDGVVPVGVC